MSTNVEKIKERLNIVDLLGGYLKLEKAGKNLKARCPFHNEKSPSFFVSPERDSYYCFGCGAKGDIFTFVQEFEGLDFFGALKLLAEKTGVELARENIGQKNEKEAIYNCLEAATQFFESNLPKSSPAQEYLKKRGLHEKTIKDWRIGFALDDWHTLYEYLSARKFTDIEIEQAGLIKRGEARSTNDDHKHFYDRFRARIMFPIRDGAGRVAGFSGRILPQNDDGKAAKYLNSPETAVFNKSRILYGFDLAKLAIKKFDYAVIVEGQMDIIMCHQAGFQNVVATSGTALTPEHLTLLRRISNRAIMAFDADKAGANAATKAWQLALSLGMEVKIAEFKDGKDPADVIFGENGKEKFKDALRGAKHIIDYYLSRILDEKLDERKIGAEVRARILPFLALIESNIEKSHFVKKICSATGISENAIWDDLKKVKIEPTADGARATISPNVILDKASRLDSIERKILGFLHSQELKEKKSIDPVVVRKRFREIIGESAYDDLMKIPPTILNEVSFEIEEYYDEKKIPIALEELLFELEKETIRKSLVQSMQALVEVEKRKDLKARDELVTKCNELTKRLSQITNQRSKTN
jgi:DNA primase